MRFLEGGPPIPEALVLEQERGGTLFVCGAGVSMTVGLPSFHGLVAHVYEALGEDWKPYPAELEVMRADGSMKGQYDRCLNSLQRRLIAGDPRLARHVIRRMEHAIDTKLSIEKVADAAAHRDLLALSTGSDGEQRLLTTNFDTLFERSRTMAGLPKVESFAGPAMPGPGSASFQGVLHLHGRLEDKVLDLQRTDLVLTSAEFGEAYLRSGWAARYVYDLSRAYTLVLVGYAADDPPMRYLLEVLEADRARYPDLKPVYAFAPAREGEDEWQAALWRAKGIEPIIYREQPNDDHSLLYETLVAWKSYAQAPGAWRESRLRELTATGPKAADEEKLAEIATILTSGDAKRLLWLANPPASWFALFVDHPMLEERRNILVPWVSASFDDPVMFDACQAHACRDPVFYRLLGQMLEHGPTRPRTLLARAWRLLIQARLRRSEEEKGPPWYGVLPRIRALDIDGQVIRAVVEVVRPVLDIHGPFGLAAEAGPSQAAPERLTDLLRTSFSAGVEPSFRTMLDEWPNDIELEVDLFVALDRALEEALDTARHSGHLDRWDLASAEVQAVSQGSHDEVGRGFFSLTRMVADLWTRIATKDKTKAQGLAARWKDGRYLLRTRLYLHALADDAFDASEGVSALQALDDTSFWVNEAHREVNRLLLARWGDFPERERMQLETRLREGVPRSLARDNLVTEDQWEAVRCHALLQALGPIGDAGGTMLPETTEALRAAAEMVRPRPVPAAADDDGIATIVGPAGDIQQLANLPDEELLGEALRLQRLDWLREGQLWRMLCEADPSRALRGLMSASEEDRWRSGAVPDLLASAQSSQDEALERDLSDLVTKMPSEVSRDHIMAGAAWVNARARFIRTDEQGFREFLLAAWDRLAELTFKDGLVSPSGNMDSPFDRAIVSEGGQVAHAFLSMIGAGRFQKDSGFGVDGRARLDRMLNAEGTQGLNARVLLVSRLHNLDWVDPEWTADRLVPRLRAGSPEAAVLWAIRAEQPIGLTRLFNALKPDFLRELRRHDLSRRVAAGHAAKLVEAAHWISDAGTAGLDLTYTEVRQALASAAPLVRQAAAGKIMQMMQPTDPSDFDAAGHWRAVVGPLFGNIWPRDASTRAPRVSHVLAMMALECGDAFANAVEVLEPTIGPWRITMIDGLFAWDSTKRRNAECHPKAYLDLLGASIDPKAYPPPEDLGAVLDRMAAAEPSILHHPAFVRLDAIRRRAAVGGGPF